MKIDAHHHFWKFDSAQYGWINESMSVLQRDFLPADLEQEIKAAGIDGVVTVHARQTLEETRWLLDLAEEHAFIKGVVGWVPLAEPDIREQLDSLARQPALKGVRHVVQDEPDDDFLLGKAFNAGVDALANHGLVYDILIYERQLPQAIQFVDRHPNQVFVLDHVAKPQVRNSAVEPWGHNIRQLAQRENVYCKVSGLATEADWGSWTEPQLTVYLDTVLEAFGAKRLMFGSDWPVCLLATTYASWYEFVRRWIAELSAEEQVRILGHTAIEAYQLKVPVRED
jgi:L-fucono-1,5-lactonase